MGLYHLVAFALSVATVGIQPPAELPMPIRIGSEQAQKGNPLAQYAEIIRREPEYLGDEVLAAEYWQARATFSSIVGDYEDANRSWDQSRLNLPPAPVSLRDPLAGYAPTDAVEQIAEAARKHRWVMLGEEHVKPQTRSLMVPLLRALHAQGYRYLAVETLAPDASKRLSETGHVDLGLGFYTVDPVFAAGLREAVRLGFELVPYEVETWPEEMPASDPMFRQNYRERAQAENLKERIFDQDPEAKVIVWAGRGHVLETKAGDWTPMAYVFRELTGEDPLSVYLAAFVEASERRFERSTYRWASDFRTFDRATVFVDRDGQAYGESFDIHVFFPRTRMVQGRPHWLRTEVGRLAVPIPPGLVQAEGLQLVQAFGSGEPETAVPLDQFVIRPGDVVPALMLPSGRCWVRVIDPAGNVLGRAEVTVP